MGSRGIEINSGSVFRFLIQPAIPKLVNYTTQQLIQSGHSGTLEIEIYEFVVMKHLCSTFCVSNNVAWSQIKLIAVANGFTLMNQNRYGAILSSLQGFDQIHVLLLKKRKHGQNKIIFYTKSTQLSN